VWTHTVAVWQVMVLATYVGIVNAFDIPSRQAFMVELVGKEDLVNAIALNSSLFNATRIVGPAIAGVIIGASGVGLCFFLNGVSYIAVVWGLLAMRLPKFVERPSTESEWERFRGGLRFILSDRRMSALVLQVAILSLFGFPVLVMMPVFARDVLHTQAGGYGALMAAVGLGAMLGALALALVSDRVPKGRTLLAGGVAFSILLSFFALSPWFPVSLGLLALTGCAMIVTTALTNTLIQTLVPDELRGRVMGFYAFMFVGMAPLGAFQAGWLSERIGAPLATAIGGVICLAAMLISWWRIPELREER
jgi:MFS family permease